MSRNIRGQLRRRLHVYTRPALVHPYGSLGDATGMCYPYWKARSLMINDLWYKNAVIYCLSVGTYMDANGDGIGDFQGLMRRLDYLHGLGVTAIWLMPFQTSPARDDGYDVSDYYSVDPRYGTLGDFVEFTHGAKQRGIRVLIDLVVNHTSERAPLVPGGAARSRIRSTATGMSGPRRSHRARNEGMVFPGVQKSTWTLRRAGAKPGTSTASTTSSPTSTPRTRRCRPRFSRSWGSGSSSACPASAWTRCRSSSRTKGAEVEEAEGAIRHAPHASANSCSGDRATASCSPRPTCCPRPTWNISARRRPHAHDVQFPGQPAPVLRAGLGRYAPAGQGDEGDEAAPGDGAMGPVPAQSRRTRSRPADEEQRQTGLRRVRARTGDAALRPRHPAAAGADAGRRPPAARARLQPDVHAAGDAGHPLRRRDRHGRRSLSCRSAIARARRCNGRTSRMAASPKATSRSCR